MMGRRIADARAMRGSAAQKREKSVANRKSETARNRLLFSGWNLPFVPDENDIVAWVKREKNGDNKKKPRRDEEVPEEAYRHMFSRCCSLENQMEFERESLVQRYRKHCQFGPLASEKNRAAQATERRPSLTEEKERISSTPSRALRFPRSCKSAEVPGTPKVSTLHQVGLGDEELESLIPTRSHSVIDDSKLRAYGLTLPPDEKTARLLELAGKFIARAELQSNNNSSNNNSDTAKRALATAPAGGTGAGLGVSKCGGEAEELQDEGYDSKISSNNDAEGGEEDREYDENGSSRVVQLDTASDRTNLDSILHDGMSGTVTDYSEVSGWTDCYARVPPPDDSANLVHAQLTANGRPHQHRGAAEARRVMPQYQAPADSGTAAIAKLMYSQRDRNLYERAPSRRMRHNGFRYAGKEQSRLMETSLNYITPGYLSMHQFANLSHFVQHPQPTLHEVVHQHQHHQQQHQNNLDFKSDHSTQQQPQADTTCTQDQPEASPTTHTTPTGVGGAPAAVTGTRTLALRKICLQDSNSRDSRNNSPHHNHFSLEANSSSRHSSPEHHSGRNSPEPNHNITSNTSNPSYNPRKPTYHAYGAHVKKTLTPTEISPDGILTQNGVGGDKRKHSNSKQVEDASQLADATGTEPASSTPAPGDQQVVASGSTRPPNAPPATAGYEVGGGHPGSRRTSQTTIPGFRGVGGRGQTGAERLSTTCFPVADLLPAVEKSLRRKGRRGLSRHQQQLLYRSQTSLLDAPLWRHSEQPVMASYPDSLNFSSAPALVGIAGSDATLDEESTRSTRLYRHPMESILRPGGGVSLLVNPKGQGPPGFRPHHSLSPLQRAKDIVNRRLHGHITQLPDGSETVQVTSPQYQSSSRHDRISSASRRLDRIIHGSWRLGS